MLSVLIYLLIFAVVFGLLFWLLTQLPLPAPWGTVARVLLVLIAVILLLYFLVGDGPRLRSWDSDGDVRIVR